MVRLQIKITYCLLGLILCLGIVSCTNKKNKFDSKAWKADHAGRTAKRSAMIDDLLQSDTLKQKRLKEVIDLLGTDYYAQLELDGTMTLSYVVEEAYGWGIDPKYNADLVITFDKDSLRTVKNITLEETGEK